MMKREAYIASIHSGSSRDNALGLKTRHIESCSSKDKDIASASHHGQDVLNMQEQFNVLAISEQSEKLDAELADHIPSEEAKGLAQGATRVTMSSGAGADDLRNTASTSGSKGQT